MQNISEYTGPNLTYFTGSVSVLVGIIFHIFVWQSPKARCYDNQLTMGDVRKRRVQRPILFASVFDNVLADCKSTFKTFNGNNQAVSQFGELPSCNLGVYDVKTHNFCRDLPAI